MKAELFIFYATLSIAAALDFLLIKYLHEDTSLGLGGIGEVMFLFVIICLEVVGFLLLYRKKIGGFVLLVVANLFRAFGLSEAIRFLATGSTKGETSAVLVGHVGSIAVFILIILLALLLRDENVNKPKDKKPLHIPQRLAFSAFSRLTQRFIVYTGLVLLIIDCIQVWSFFTFVDPPGWNPAIIFVAVILQIVGVLLFFYIQAYIGLSILAIGHFFLLFFLGTSANHVLIGDQYATTPVVSTFFNLVWLAILIIIPVIGKNFSNEARKIAESNAKDSSMIANV
ncbi:MAG: hypothetical protein WC786_02100 [Patescibacteria group bacterium]